MLDNFEHVLDAVPFVSRLVAGTDRLTVMSTSRERLRLGNLRSDLHDRPDRHRTMRSTIEWSVDGLEPTHRQLLARLAVFAAPAPLAAVSAVWAEPDADVVDVLVDLVDKSLVRRLVGPDGEPWFTMLELIREYAAEMSQAWPDRDEIRRRHAREVACALADLEADRWGPAAAYWIDVIKARSSDIEAAYSWARADGDFRLAAEIAAPLYAYWHRVGHHAQGTTWTRQSLADATELSPMTTALLHLGAGYLDWAHQRMAAARDHWESALETCRDIGSDRYESFCLTLLAGLSIGRTDGYAQAFRRCEEGIELARRTGELPLLATALTIKGELTRAHADDVAALAASIG